MSSTKIKASLIVVAAFVAGCSGAVSLPDSFPTVAELAELSDPFAVPPSDARIESSLELTGDTGELEAEETNSSMVITYFDDMVVWDYDHGLREVSIGGRVLVQTADGSWVESEDFEWPLFGPVPDWFSAQSIAASCLELGPEPSGAAEIAGVVTMNARCNEEGGSIDVWVVEFGRVMKLVVEYRETGTDNAVTTNWEVTDLDFAPGEPLP